MVISYIRAAQKNKLELSPVPFEDTICHLDKFR